LPVAEPLAPGGGGASRAEALGVALRVQDVPPAHAADVRVRARPEAPPVVRAPVAAVVRAARAVARRPVADLVPLEPEGGEGPVAAPVAARLELRVGRGERAPP